MFSCSSLGSIAVLSIPDVHAIMLHMLVLSLFLGELQTLHLQAAEVDKRGSLRGEGYEAAQNWPPSNDWTGVRCPLIARQDQPQDKSQKS